MKRAIIGISYGFMLILGVLLALPGVGCGSVGGYGLSSFEACALGELSSGRVAELSVGQDDEQLDMLTAGQDGGQSCGWQLERRGVSLGLSDLLRDVTLEPVLSVGSASCSVPLARRHWHSFSGFGLGYGAAQLPRVLVGSNLAEAANFRPYQGPDPTHYYIYTLHRIRI